MAKCLYCDGWQVVAGQGCLNSPTGTHVVDDGPKRCMYCDLNHASPDANCIYSPSGHHILGHSSTIPHNTFDSTKPFLIWVSILSVFTVFAVPSLYLFHWSINTTASKVVLTITFIISFAIGYKFAHHILKAILVIIGVLFVGFVLYEIIF